MNFVSKSRAHLLRGLKQSFCRSAVSYNIIKTFSHYHINNSHILITESGNYVDTYKYVFSNNNL